ncbi:unnamed protein product [Diatraea saccharalis]|uniref:Uncharacterized protein n=1 Tax=Diatraea saccharalis TaxID=40085 RepID=A0A9N9R2L2_9NEOP|nr:unnamed protein product [Diatraea saccharalis]
MVLLRTSKLLRASGCRGPITGTAHIEKFNFHIFGSILFNLCKACQIKTMAAIPPCTFTAGRVRERLSDRDKKIALFPKHSEYGKFFETKFAELTPLKYNSKLMNSIWGLYNRYSPHNVKKINEASFVFNGDLQQSAVNSFNKAEPVINIPPAKLDNMWAAINVSQSH